MDYIIKGEQCKINLGVEFRDEEASVKLGEIKEVLRRRNRPKNVLLDLTTLEWADPLPLLALSAILKTVTHSGTKVLFDLGSNDGNIHPTLLKFLATQGFLAIFLSFGDVKHKGILFKERDKIKLVSSLEQIPQHVNYRNAECVLAQLVCVSDFSDDTNYSKVHDFVEDLVKEANDRLFENSFGQDPLVKDRMLQKTRKILFEITCNAVDHAYPSKKVKAYAGLYARMRSGIPAESDEVQQWRRWNEKERRSCPGVKSFEPNPLAPWLEIFICDVGVGLFADLESWTVPVELKKVKTALDKLKRDVQKGVTRDPLKTLSRALFSLPFSRFGDRSGGRTSVTGLLHLGLMLRQDTDFTRMYTRGEWVGSRHPWSQHLSEHGAHNVSRAYAKDAKECAPGTWYAFSIQPDKIELEYPKGSWALPSESAKARLKKALAMPPLHSVPKNIRFEDRRSDPYCSLPPNWVYFENIAREKIFNKKAAVVLRPPRSFQKSQLGLWLERMVAASTDLEPRSHKPTFIICDLTPFQAITYSELLLNKILPPDCDLDVYLVTEDWATCCLSKDSKTGRGTPRYDYVKSEGLISANIGAGEPVFSGVGILRLLRHADSQLFWKPDENGNLPDDMFFHDKVAWPNSRSRESYQLQNSQLVISGYLDLARALVDAERHHACLRALRRCLTLFPEYEAMPSDDLVSSITLAAKEGRHLKRRGTANTINKKVVIGSIRVTSNTVTRFLARSDIPKGSEALFIFNHPDAPIVRTGSPPSVLDWIPPKANAIVTGASKPVYERIPETPYIGIGGERAITIPRFGFKETISSQGKVAPFSFYERTPQQTYDDFHRLRALKFGHWVYGNKHDLITINISRCVELSILDNGSLCEWLIAKINAACYEDSTSPEPSAVLLYPSHPVTDQLVALILQQRKKNLKGALVRDTPEKYVVPLKFLLNTSVSPLQASPLSYERLKKAIVSLAGSEFRNEARVVILDDGTLSGKIFREMEQMAMSLGASEVQTVSIVDRGGLPVHVNYMKKFISNHHRFWRWDVPPLGPPRSCAVCAALSQVSMMRHHFESGMIKRRLSEWEFIWHGKDVLSGWEHNGVDQIQLGRDPRLDQHRFGIYAIDDKDYTHKIHHRTVTGMAAAIIEITRCTTHRYYALHKARKMSKVYGPEAGIEIVASQFLLFIDEFDYWQKFDRLKELIMYLWQCKDNSAITALAGLCITLADVDVAVGLWKWTKEHLIQKMKVGTLDARACTEVLRLKYNSVAIESDHMSSNPCEMERYNYLVMFPDKGFRQNIANIFEIIGASHREIHNVGLLASLKEMEYASAANDHSRTVRALSQTKVMLEKLCEALHRFASPFSIPVPVIGLCPLDDFKHVTAIYSSAPIPEPGNEHSFLERIPIWVQKVREFILTDKQSLAQKYRNNFVLTLSPGVATSTLLCDVVRRVVDVEWKQIIETRIKIGKPVNPRWYQKSEDVLAPLVECANSGKWARETSLYYDKCISHCLYEVLVNCVHCEKEFSNPWGNPISDTDVKATMWWRVNEGDNFILIEFANACNRPFVLSPTEARSGLERVGGELTSYVIDGSRIYSPEPNGDRPPNVSELIGLQPDARLALTMVKIPTISALKEK